MFLCMCMHVRPDREATGRARGRPIHMLYLFAAPVIHHWRLIIDMPIVVRNVSVQHLCACLCLLVETCVHVCECQGVSQPGLASVRL